MSLVRILRTAQITLTHTWYVDEDPTSATGDVTYSISRLDGTSVATGTAVGPVTPGVYRLTVPSSANVDTYIVDWLGSVGGSIVTARDVVEIVGGFIFGLAEARATPPVLSETVYPGSTLAAARAATEVEAEEICGQAFVPRFARVALTARGQRDLVLPRTRVRALRAVTVGGVTQSLAGLSVSEAGVISGGFWPDSWPRKSIVVEFEHGMDYPPEDLKEAVMLRLRSRLGMFDSGVPQRALSFTATDGGTYRLSTPSKKRTGVQDVDATYERYWSSVAIGGFA